MYEYLRELHRVFDTKPKSLPEMEEYDHLQAEFKKYLGDDERKMLLRLIDIESVIRYETSLESFAAGFKLAYGLCSELSSSGHFSYEKREEERLCQR